MAGLLDVDPSQIPGMDQGTLDQLKAFIAMMQPSQQTVQQAKSNRLIDFGLGLMGARKGNEWATVGNSGLNAMQNYNKDIAAQQALQGQNVSQAMQMLQMARANQGLQQDADIGKSISKINAGATATPTTLSGPAATFQTPGGAAALVGDAASGAPSPSNNLPTQQAPTTPSTADGVRALANQYRQYAQIYAQAGPRYATQFKEYASAADALEKQLEYSTTPQITLDKNGKPVNTLINKSGGTMQMANEPAIKQEQVNLGNKIAFADPYSGNMKPGNAIYELAQSPDSKASNAVAWANNKETVRYHNAELGLDDSGKPTNVEGTARLIANYDAAPLTGWAMSKPLGMNVMSRVLEINPQYNAQEYQASQKALNAFSAGKEGAQLRANNVAIQHIGLLKQAITALGNGDIPLFNTVKNAYQQATGSELPTNVDAIKQFVGNEVVKGAIGAGGGVGDREKTASNLSRAGSPAQLVGALDQYQGLLAGQIQGLKRQYETTTKRTDFDRFLLPETQKALGSVGQGSSAPASSGTSVTAPDGTVLSFPTVAAANAFKKLHNLQ